MRTFIFSLTTLLLVACNNKEKNNGDQPKETPSATISLEERIAYEADSSIKVVYQIDVNSDNKHGSYKEYNVSQQEDGSLGGAILMVEREYQQGKITGTEKLYYPDGQVDAIITYENGINHGPFKYFYPNGQLKQNGEYVEGKIEGTLRGFYMDGTPKEEVAHQEGVTQGAIQGIQ